MDAAPPDRPSFDDDWRPSPNKKATTAMGLGIVALLCMPLMTIVFGPAALVTAYIARREIDGNPGRFTNRGMATAGAVMASVAIVISIAYYVYRSNR